MGLQPADTTHQRGFTIVFPTRVVLETAVTGNKYPPERSDNMNPGILTASIRSEKREMNGIDLFL